MLYSNLLVNYFYWNPPNRINYRHHLEIKTVLFTRWKSATFFDFLKWYIYMYDRCTLHYHKDKAYCVALFFHYPNAVRVFIRVHYNLQVDIKIQYWKVKEHGSSWQKKCSLGLWVRLNNRCNIVVNTNYWQGEKFSDCVNESTITLTWKLHSLW